METKSTNEVKGDYDRVSASECLGSLIELHGIVMEDDLFVIPDADGTAVLYNDGKIRFDEIADIEVGSVFVGILLRNGYLFYLSRTEPLKTCIYTHGGWGSISEISPRGIAGHIGRELHGKLGDHTAVDCRKQKNRTVVVRFFRVVFSRPLPAVFPFPPLQGEQLPQHVGMVFPHGMPRGHQVGTCEALPALAYRLF